MLGRARSWMLSATFIAAACVAPDAAAAEHARVVLRFQDSTKSNCPNETAFRELVAARLGYDPFVASSERALAVDLQRKGTTLVGRMTPSDGAERTLKAARSECLELVTSMAFAAALAIDPEAAKRPASPPPPPEPSAPPPSPSVEPPAAPPLPPPPPPRREPEPGARIRIEAAVLAPFGITPAMSGGARLGLGVDFGTFSIGGEGAFLFPSTKERAYGEVSAYVLSGSIVPCVNAAPGARVLVSFCAVGTLGAMNATASRVTRAEPTTDLMATAGPRVALVGLLSRSFGIGLTAEVPVSLSRVHLSIDDGGQLREVWAQRPVGFIGGLTALVRLE